uniref:Putative secreted protein n=1 Tax=Anopheles darlingi TaxID=43151 RepID=A0A2M4DCK6_ANODA
MFSLSLSRFLFISISLSLLLEPHHTQRKTDTQTLYVPRAHWRSIYRDISWGGACTHPTGRIKTTHKPSRNYTQRTHRTHRTLMYLSTWIESQTKESRSREKGNGSGSSPESFPPTAHTHGNTHAHTHARALLLLSGLVWPAAHGARRVYGEQHRPTTSIMQRAE